MKVVIKVIKKVVILLIVILLSCQICFAYSFLEFPLLSADDYYKGCNIIFKDTNEDKVYYFTSPNYPSNITGFTDKVWITPGDGVEFKIYQLHDSGEYWEFIGDNVNRTSLTVYGIDIYCSDVYLFWDFQDDSTGWFEFYPNSIVPTLNYSQMQYEELKEISSKIENNDIRFYSMVEQMNGNIDVKLNDINATILKVFMIMITFFVLNFFFKGWKM